MVKRTKTISYIAILTALASAIYYVESFLPMPVSVPGARWGFSNFPLLLSVVSGISVTNTLYIALLKTILGSILSGRFLSPMFWMGLGGSLASALFMSLSFKITNKFGILGISEIGAFFSNTVQLIIASLFIVKSPDIFWYFPYMLFFGILTAFINATIVNYILRSVRLDRFKS
ncbi:heptaprenyl diphosphate synthase [Petrotoga sp. HWH.PT.55.6.1]|uniref:Gx transporter family protein n=1 Tax=unclassified Petrotoga TaxID=2620614 RepID=UPI000CA05F98|nr:MULTISPECIES: Gx transporter family protein [unclassified Petrotoga]PNR94364.1 heptaprenyl diphosphate synthase [Petrotoga sp. HWHPT.55.6.3]RPD35326.1 heptaprenyl diphosphate synthase [Petrotoga sp. HWH.PT.55.6.1]